MGLVETGRKYGTTKLHHPHYLPIYDENLRERRLGIMTVLEFGVGNGESLAMWCDYFPNAKIYGIDNFCEHHGPRGKIASAEAERARRGSPWVSYGRAKVFIADQTDAESCGNVVSDAGGSFDLIIDDAGHDPADQISCLKFMFQFVIAGGIYVIEDLESSYWTKGHSSGIKIVGPSGTERGYDRPPDRDGFRYDDSAVEFLKGFVDGLNRDYIHKGIIPHLVGLESIQFFPNMAWLRKS